ncbi:hypothetical protein OIU34_23200 [Pararhizobium sp. BT-229]|uniref:hypothetical protein n=1 Tax=Pararhizobium sp. BT-229 TaxID=2986923 RepID=UPI0021F7DECE|nr:hypothetical protein [Pararhizobium sp. BT-229]MCV9964803.1 hypothetical protein [Pararhizobium sp. BT-229]
MPLSVECYGCRADIFNHRPKEASSKHLQSTTTSSSVPRLLCSSHDAFETDPNDMIVNSTDPRPGRAAGLILDVGGNGDAAMTNWNSTVKRIGALGVKVAGLSIAAGMTWWGIVEGIRLAARYMEATGVSSWAVLTPLCVAAVLAFLWWLSAEVLLVVRPRTPDCPQKADGWRLIPPRHLGRSHTSG